MNTFLKFAAGILGVIAFTPLAYADTPSISIQSLSPGASAVAKTLVSFKVAATGYYPTGYQLQDSFSGTTATVGNFDPAGNFSWVPVASDVGTHTFTITANDYNAHTATVTQTITVLPLPSLAVQDVSPSSAVMPGTTVTFTIAPTSFTNPTYIVGDTFSGTSATNKNIDSSGHFSWTPDATQNGEHTITIYANDSQGHNASVQQYIRVGAGPSLAITNLNPSTGNAKPGTTISFTVAPLNYSPSGFSIMDSFSGSTASNGNINTTGVFSWVPSASDTGVHTLTITGVVGAFGQSASTTQKVTVLNADGSMPASSAMPAIPSNATTTATTSSTASAGSGASNNSAISSLLAQVAALQAKIATAGGTPAANTPAASAPGFMFVTYLHPGMKGDEVVQLQKVLKAQGFFSDEPSGYFGSITADAVVKFQAAHGLDQLGVVGPGTRAALNALGGSSAPSTTSTDTSSSASGGSFVFTNFLEIGARGDEVLQLQKKLSSLGFFSDEPSGYFGPLTAAAVKKFQAAHEIDVKGWVGPATRAALNK